MRYVIVDLEGSSRDYFDSRSDLLSALGDIEAEYPGMAAQLFVLKHDGGAQVGEPERGDEVLATPLVTSPTSYVIADGSVITQSTGTIAAKRELKPGRSTRPARARVPA